MKTGVEVIAYAGKGENKTEVGRTTIDVPETLEEAVSLLTEATVLKLVNQARHTNTRNSLAKPATGGGTKKKILFDVYNKMVAAGLPQDEALRIAGLTADDLKSLQAA